MNKTSTRKLLINLATIINIIYSVILILCGIFFLYSLSLINYDFIVELLTEDGSISNLSDAEINSILSIVKGTFRFFGIYCLIISVAQLVVSIILNNKNSSFKENKGLIITLLVLSLFATNILVVGLLIGALCLSVEKNMEEVFNVLDKPDDSSDANIESLKSKENDETKQ